MIVCLFSIKDTLGNNYKVSVCAILNRNFDLIDVIFVKVISIFFGLDTFFMLKTIINSVRYHYLI